MVIMCNFSSYMHGHVRLPASLSKRRGGEQRHNRVEADSGNAKLWRVELNCASHKSKKTNKPAMVRDEQTIDISYFLL
jgi:hypothetical protein